MDVLITGGAGYIGSIHSEHLVDAGHRVTVVDSLVYGEQGLTHLCANPRFDVV
jgi:UDP-glucose 4-epimerase